MAALNETDDWLEEEISRSTYPPNAEIEGDLPTPVYWPDWPSVNIFISQHFIYDVGFLERFPLEIQRQILIRCDLDTLDRFAATNRKAYWLRLSLVEYSTIMRHVPRLISNIRYMDTGRWITCIGLYEKLCMPLCESCGDFCTYLYLITCKRVCLLCADEKAEFQPLPRSVAAREYKIYEPLLRDLPRMFSGGDPHVDTESVWNVSQSLRLQALRPAGRTPVLSNANPHSGYRISTAVRTVPWLDKVNDTLVAGFYCCGCKDGSERPLHPRRKYNAKTFKEHIRALGRVRDGVHETLHS